MAPVKKIESAEFTNMCMVYDDNRNVLVQKRVKGWCGLAFPGGHLEPYESIVDSVIREIKEETGLTIKNPKLCGVKQAFFPDGGRYIVYLYKSNEFEGELSSNDEGNNFWIPLEELKQRKSEMSDNFEYMLEVFTNDELSEHYHRRYDESTVKDIVK